VPWSYPKNLILLLSHESLFLIVDFKEKGTHCPLAAMETVGGLCRSGLCLPDWKKMHIAYVPNTI